LDKEEVLQTKRQFKKNVKYKWEEFFHKKISL
jgi:hypothetical protein